MAYRRAIAEAGVVPLLVGLVAHHNEDVTWQAAGALRAMIQENGACETGDVCVSCVSRVLGVVAS